MTQKLLIILACAMVLSLFTAAATPAYCPTTPTSLTFFIGLGQTGCQVGDKVFWGFKYTPSGTPIDQEPAGNINVTTLGPAGTLGAGGVANPPSFQNDIGLEFGGTWAATTGDGTPPQQNAKSDGLVSFNVTVVGGGGMQIEDAGVLQTSFVGGTGQATVGEKGCSAPNAPGQDCSQLWGVATSDGVFINHTFFTPTGSIGVSKDISAVSGSSGTASITGVEDVFSQTAVPEPRAISMLLGLGLAAGLTLKRKFQRVRS